MSSSYSVSNYGTTDKNDVSNSDVKVKVTSDQPYAGMDKDTLLRFSQAPLWRHLRTAILCVYILGWLGILGTIIGVSVVYPRCPVTPQLEWWQKSIVYQIFPRSFQDSNADGVGDLKGIESRLDYIKDLGVGALWMGSVYKSPMKDFGYDVSDFKDIDPVFGTLDDMKNLIAKMKEIGLHLILDFIPNHTSDQHAWFNNSRQATDPRDRYYSYYVWRDCGNDTYRDYPTNWVSVFGNSSWTYDSVRKQCYLHQYLKEQPDLNLMNPYVQEELENILQYWMDLGVDGFRVSATSHLFEDYLWRDEPIIDSSKSQVDYQNFFHNFTISQPATFDILARWRALLDHQTEKDGVYKLLMADVTDASEEDQMKYYGLYGRDGADMPHNFGLLQKLNRNCGGTCVKDVVEDWLSNMPPGRWPNFLVGNHNYPRILTKMDAQFVNAINMLLLLLPGTPTTYYGEEIGMNDIAQPTPPQDPWGRDPERSPMQWSNASLAGFSNCTGNYDPQKCPWLPVNQDYLAGVNVQAQEQDKDSSLNLYKSLAKLRQEPTFLHGNMKYAIVDDDIFSYVKDWPGETNYMVVINLSPTNTTHTLDLTSYIQTAEADIAETTRLNMDPSLVVGNSLVPDSVLLKTGQGIVLKWKYSPVEIWHKDES